RVAFHWSNLPAIATEAFTENVTKLSSCVITKVGTCARLSGARTADATRPKIAILIVECDQFSQPCQMKTQRSSLSSEPSSGRPWLPGCRYARVESSKHRTRTTYGSRLRIFKRASDFGVFKRLLRFGQYSLRDCERCGQKRCDRCNVKHFQVHGAFSLYPQ